jgi:hypothetical protein
MMGIKRSGKGIDEQRQGKKTEPPRHQPALDAASAMILNWRMLHVTRFLKDSCDKKVRN